MINTLLFDFSRVLLFPRDKEFKGKLNALHKELSEKKDYSFLDHFELNEDLLEYLNSLEGKYDCYIFTSGSIQEATDIQTQISSLFKGVFSSKEFGAKSDSDSYKKVAEKIGKTPAEIVFIDDSETNVIAARAAGLKAEQYTSNDQIKAVISALDQPSHE